MAATKPQKTIREIEQLQKEPTEDNWKKALKIIQKGKYYYIYYPNALKGKMSLSSAYAIIYDKSEKPIFKVPILKKTKNGIEGATSYLVGLEINREMIK